MSNLDTSLNSADGNFVCSLSNYFLYVLGTIEDLVYRDVSRFSEDFVVVSSYQDSGSLNRKFVSCSSTSKNFGTSLDILKRETSSVGDHPIVYSRCEMIERKFYYGSVHFVLKGYYIILVVFSLALTKNVILFTYLKVNQS